jgi:hypothetical protein
VTAKEADFMAKRSGVRIVIAALVAACATAMSSSGQAQLLGQTKFYAGALTCNVSASVGFLFGSTKELTCVFARPDGSSEAYSGSIDRYGIDIGFTKARHVLWNVYTLTETPPPPGALAGSYVGSQESVAVGATAGGNVLISGGDRKIVLSAVVIRQSGSGLNFADGIAEMTLRTASY